MALPSFAEWDESVFSKNRNVQLLDAFTVERTTGGSDCYLRLRGSITAATGPMECTLCIEKQDKGMYSSERGS